MTEVVQAIRRVTQVVSEITTATGEQSQGMDQINEAVMQIDQTTQQNAALVQTVAVFQLPHDAPAGSATTQRIAPQAQRTPGLLPARA